MRGNWRGNGLEQEVRNELNEEYGRLRTMIGGSRLVLRVAPYHKMRISAWLRKMDETADNNGARKIRNNYAKLMNLMCQCQVIVTPFDMAPEGNLPRLSKLRINQIIDEVEEGVRLGQEIEGVYESCQAFNQAAVPSSSIIASEAEEVVEEEERSQVIGRFVNQSLKKAPDYSGTYFSVMQESRESQTSQEKTFFSDMKPASVDYFPIAMDCQQKERRKARHIKVEINTFHTKMPASPAFQRLEQSRNSQPSPSFSDTSQQLRQGQRSFHRDLGLSKETPSQEALSQTNCQQIQEILNEDPDFSSQLSERCREKDNPRNSQIAWAFKKENASCEANFDKQKLAMTESIPSKGLFRTSTFNSKNSSTSKETLQQRLKTDPDESFTSKLSLASELRDYEASPLRDLTNFSFLAI